MNVRERAAYYLNIKPRTRMQVEKYLKEKGFDESEIIEAVEELEEYGYINDKNFASMYFQLGFDKGRAVSRIKRELTEKGVSSEDIEEAFMELENVPDEYDAALSMAREIVNRIIPCSAAEEISQLEWKDRQKLLGKIAGRLSRRGYSSSVVYRASKEAIDERTV